MLTVTPIPLKDKHWTNLQIFPCPLHRDIQCSSLLQLNQYEFLMAPHWPRVHDANKQLYDKVGLFKYNIIEDQWSLFMNYNEQYNPKWHQVCINSARDKIYSTGNRSPLTIVDLKEKTCQQQATDIMPFVGSSASILMTDDVCHVIGGSSNNKHYSNAADGTSFEAVYEFEECGAGYSGFAVIYLRSQNMLVLFGGYKYDTATRSKEIWTHKLGTKQWSRLPQTLPFAMNSFGIVVTSDEKYAITFGGVTNVCRGEIVIINLMTFQYVISPIKVPKEREPHFSFYHAAKWDDNVNNELLVSGFIRNHVNELKAKLPPEIVQLFMKWYSVEYVFLVSSKGWLWKIAMSDLLNSCDLP